MKFARGLIARQKLDRIVVDECHITVTALFAQHITIKYPGYGGNNTSLVLPACDGTCATGKAHYATIYTACVIIANNRKDGRLSLAHSGQPPVSADSEGLISAGVYFSHANSGPSLKPYSIFPNFCAWIFPHNDLPSLWHESAQSAVAIEPRTATETCRLTMKRLACENSSVGDLFVLVLLQTTVVLAHVRPRLAFYSDLAIPTRCRKSRASFCRRFTCLFRSGGEDY